MTKLRIKSKPVFVVLLCFAGTCGIIAYRLAFSQEVKTLHLSDDVVAQVTVSSSGTVLSFPIKPTKVILGKSGSFGIEYVENDLAISPLTPAARSHLFVYLFARRFSFDLSVGVGGSSVILVREAEGPVVAPKSPKASQTRWKKGKG